MNYTKKQLTLDHLSLDNNLITFLQSNYSTGVILTVEDTTGYIANDYIVMGKVGAGQSEIVQIQSVDSASQLTLVTAPNYPHPANTVITEIGYNKINVYYSTTGVGGVYTLLDRINIQADQNVNTYDHWQSLPSYSYKMSFFNVSRNIESNFSDEIPYGGWPFFSVKSISDRTDSIFENGNWDLLNPDEVMKWTNEFNQMCQFEIMGSDSPYYITNQQFTIDATHQVDISSYDMIRVFMVEISYDGGITWPDFVTPKDFRFKDMPGAISSFDYEIAGNLVIFSSNMQVGANIRIWFATTPVLLQSPSDILLSPFKGHSYAFVNYNLMRAHEKDRKFSEGAIYYQNFVEDYLKNTQGLIAKIKQRIKQGGMPMATTYADNYESMF